MITKLFNLQKKLTNIVFPINYLRIDLFSIRIQKLIFILKNNYFLSFVLKGIFPVIEHVEAINKIGQCSSLIDCGCNKGQFFILFHFKKKIKNLLCFDPIINSSSAFNLLEKKDVKIIFKKVALSNKFGTFNFYISKRKDSSSLKKFKKDSSKFFHDVEFKNSILVNVRTLDSYEELIKNLPKPIALKLDVQGSEYELLLGAKKILKYIKFIFIEINYISIYEIESTSSEIFEILLKYGFEIIKKYNKLERNKILISHDYLLVNKSI